MKAKQGFVKSLRYIIFLMLCFNSRKPCNNFLKQGLIKLKQGFNFARSYLRKMIPYNSRSQRCKTTLKAMCDRFYQSLASLFEGVKYFFYRIIFLIICFFTIFAPLKEAKKESCSSGLRSTPGKCV